MADEYNTLIERMLASSEIQKLYDEFIIKDITFKEWVVGTIDDLYMRQRTYDANHALGSLG